jgi:glycosyltransferase involved in cell wall biosynthesis
MVTHEQDGLIVPPGDAESMASAVRRILTEPGLAAALSRRCRQTAEEFDWTLVIRQWHELLQAAPAGS